MEDYYSVGTREEPVISNSSMNYLNPESGGSPLLFLSFFDKKDEEKKEKFSLEKGQLLHTYIEHKEDFGISKVTKPTDMLGIFVDELYKTIQNIDFIDLSSIDSSITTEKKQKGAIEAVIQETTAAYSDLAELLKINTDNLIKLFRFARVQNNSYSSYGESTLINLFKNKGYEYFKELKSLEGKIILDVPTKTAIDGAITSLYTNSKIKSLLNLDEEPLPDYIEIIKEKPIYFAIDLFINDELVHIKCKIKPDHLRINHKKKHIHEIDLKSTMNISRFYCGDYPSFEKYHYDRQHSFYGTGIHEKYPDYTISHMNIVVETAGFFQSEIFNIDTSYLIKGRKEYTDIIYRYAWHKVNNLWDKSMESYLNNGIITLKYNG